MKSRTKKYATAALLTSIVLGFGAMKWMSPTNVVGRASSAESSPAESSPASAASASAEENRRPAIATRQWKEGASFVYDIDTTRRVAMTTKDEPEEIVSYQVVGRLIVTVVGTDANTVRLRVDVEPAKVDVLPASDHDGKKMMSGTFYVQATTKGEIKEFYFPGEIAIEARIVLKGLVNSFQMVVHPGNAAKWNVIEGDVSGQYHATYSADDEHTIQKSKTKYINTRGPSGYVKMHKNTQYAVVSSTRFGIHESGWPKSLVEDEKIEIALQHNRMVGTIQTSASLAKVESRPEWVGALPANLEPDTVSEAAAQAMAMKQADVNMVGGRTLAMVMMDLQGADSKLRNHSQSRLSALLRVDPSQSKNVADEILHGKGDDNSKKRMIGALGNAGTSEAQHELARLLATQELGRNRVNAEVAMALTKNPTEETLQALKNAAADPDVRVSNTATLGIGSVVHTMNTEGVEPSETADEVQLLIHGLSSATTDNQKIIYLEALGNTGDQRVLAAVTPYLAHNNVILRAAATGALKFIVGPVADQLIVAAMGDAAFAVRKAAAHTIGFRPISGVLEAADQLLKTDPEIAIRTEILQGMNTKLAEDAIVIDSVSWAMDNDPSATVRAFAQQIVDAYKVNDET